MSFGGFFSFETVLPLLTEGLKNFLRSDDFDEVTWTTPWTFLKKIPSFFAINALNANFVLLLYRTVLGSLVSGRTYQLWWGTLIDLLRVCICVPLRSLYPGLPES